IGNPSYSPARAAVAAAAPPRYDVPGPGCRRSRMSAGFARVLVCAPHVHVLTDLRRVLEGHGHEVVGHLLGTPDPDGADHCRLVVLDGSGQTAEALALCRRLRPRMEDHFVPILFVTDDHNPASRLASFEAGADTYLLRPFIAGELIAQVQALLRI